jgi:hypothetical protein
MRNKHPSAHFAMKTATIFAIRPTKNDAYMQIFFEPTRNEANQIEMPEPRPILVAMIEKLNIVVGDVVVL